MWLRLPHHYHPVVWIFQSILIKKSQIQINWKMLSFLRINQILSWQPEAFHINKKKWASLFHFLTINSHIFLQIIKIYFLVCLYILDPQLTKLGSRIYQVYLHVEGWPLSKFEMGGGGNYHIYGSLLQSCIKMEMSAPLDFHQPHKSLSAYVLLLICVNMHKKGIKGKISIRNKNKSCFQ